MRDQGLSWGSNHLITGMKTVITIPDEMEWSDEETRKKKFLNNHNF
jgi:hypothetical protein